KRWTPACLREGGGSLVAVAAAGLALGVAALAELPKLPLVENRQGRPQARGRRQYCPIASRTCSRRLTLSITGSALSIDNGHGVSAYAMMSNSCEAPGPHRS